ncbi:MAG: hypothetical protein J5654_09705 [Victivallales bacterium]|nr:hypothetical protein [Victivallales bacterium]
MKAFEKLTQTHVRIEVAGGRAVNVPMLPVADVARLDDFGKRLSEAKDAQGINAIREDMVALASTVLPEELQAGIQRLRVDKLAELLAYLMYGDGDDQPEEDAKKNEPKTEAQGTP